MTNTFTRLDWTWLRLFSGLARGLRGASQPSPPPPAATTPPTPSNQNRGLTHNEIVACIVGELTDLRCPQMAENISLSRRMTTSTHGIRMLADFEFQEDFGRAAGIVAVDSRNRIIGIYPHYVFRQNVSTGIWESDGGITMGYGVFISEASFNQNAEHRRLIDTYAPGASFVPPHTPSNGMPFKVAGSSFMRIADAEELKRTTLVRFESAVNDFLELHDVRVTQYQFDVLVSFTYNFGEFVWTLPANQNWRINVLIRNGPPFNPAEVRNAFNGFTQNHERRRAEGEIFINGH